MLTVDIAPLFEDRWTGIPIFTRRLVQALLLDASVDLHFAYRLSIIPSKAIMAAIRAGTGTCLRGDFERNAGKGSLFADPKSPVFYPSVKEMCGVSEREASTIHDVSTLVMPEYHDVSNVDYHMKNVVRQIQSDEVTFCVSEATRSAVELAYPSVAQKLKLLPQYVDWPVHFSAMERNLPPPISGRYVAVIGTLEPRKNLELLIRSLAEPQVRDSDVRFVVMGKRGWKIDELFKELSPRAQQRITFLGYVTEFTKYRLLKHAQALVYPSLYEGYGIPALEAMSLGKPVLASMTSSFPELIDKAGVYFDPLSTASFADAFETILNPVTQTQLSKFAIAEAGRYDSARMAAPILNWLTNT